MEWISVAERLPTDWGSHLVWRSGSMGGHTTAWFQLKDGGRDGRLAGCWYSEESRAESDDRWYDITHWMELPPPPAPT
jgi:hypothetical protein